MVAIEASKEPRLPLPDSRGSVAQRDRCRGLVDPTSHWYAPVP